MHLFIPGSLRVSTLFWLRCSATLRLPVLQMLASSFNGSLTQWPRLLCLHLSCLFVSLMMCPFFLWSDVQGLGSSFWLYYIQKLVLCPCSSGSDFSSFCTHINWSNLFFWCCHYPRVRACESPGALHLLHCLLAGTHSAKMTYVTASLRTLLHSHKLYTDISTSSTTADVVERRDVDA